MAIENMTKLRSVLLVFGAVGVASWVGTTIYITIIRLLPRVLQGVNASNAEAMMPMVLGFPRAVGGLVAGFLLGCVAEGGKRALWIIGLLVLSLMGLFGIGLLNGGSPHGPGVTQALVLCVTCVAGWWLGERVRPRERVA